MRVPGMSRDDIAQEIQLVLLQTNETDEQRRYWIARDHLRNLQRKRHEVSNHNFTAVESPDGFATIDAALDVDAVLKAPCDELTQTQYNVLRLTYQAGCDDASIATLCNIALASVPVRRSEALTILRKKLGGQAP